MSVSKLEGKNQAFPKLWIVDSTERSDFSNNFINEINTQEGHTYLNIVGDQHCGFKGILGVHFRSKCSQFSDA